MKEKDEELIKTKTLLGSPTLSFNVLFFFYHKNVTCFLTFINAIN